mmetsp:Transcript_7155/g.6431  ORF Transcript_7155/g.6431 Transcript_7155/m.6431 type:complete len:92 (-) Transcript_7155:656-931(-)
MSNVLTEYFHKILQGLFSDFLKDFKKNKISELHLGASNKVTIEDLEIREDFLLMNSIPLIIKEGKIGRTKISIPTLFKAFSMRIDIENVDI